MEAICTSPISPDFSPCIEPRELTVDEIDAVAGGLSWGEAWDVLKSFFVSDGGGTQQTNTTTQSGSTNTNSTTEVNGLVVIVNEYDCIATK